MRLNTGNQLLLYPRGGCASYNIVIPSLISTELSFTRPTSGTVTVKNVEADLKGRNARLVD